MMQTQRFRMKPGESLRLTGCPVDRVTPGAVDLETNSIYLSSETPLPQGKPYPKTVARWVQFGEVWRLHDDLAVTCNGTEKGGVILMAATVSPGVTATVSPGVTATVDAGSRYDKR